MRTNQEIFTHVLRFLRKQGVAAYEDGECRYRTDTGLQCALGCLIPEYAYDPIYEGHKVSSLFRNHPHLANTMQVDKRQSSGLLFRLQNAHDAALKEFGMGMWEIEMEEIAEDYNLQFEENNAD